MLVVEIDAISSEPSKRFLNHFANVLQLTIESAPVLVIKAKLACDNHLIAERRERFPRQAFRSCMDRKLPLYRKT